MVKETNEKVSRRRVLQLSGTGLAAVAGNAIIGTAVGKEPEDRGKQYVSYRANETEQNKSKFVERKRVGFAKGGFNKPVTPKTIEEYTRELLVRARERNEWLCRDLPKTREENSKNTAKIPQKTG